jgi:hypothetical protein
MAVARARIRVVIDDLQVAELAMASQNQSSHGALAGAFRLLAGSV